MHADALRVSKPPIITESCLPVLASLGWQSDCITELQSTCPTEMILPGMGVMTVPDKGAAAPTRCQPRGSGVWNSQHSPSTQIVSTCAPHTRTAADTDSRARSDAGSCSYGNRHIVDSTNSQSLMRKVFNASAGLGSSWQPQFNTQTCSTGCWMLPMLQLKGCAGASSLHIPIYVKAPQACILQYT